MTGKTNTAGQTIHVTTGNMPDMLRLVGPGVPTFAQAAVHIRRGYRFSPHVLVEFFGHSGAVAITLERGDPDSYTIECANTTMEEAMANQRAEHEKAVKEEAKRLVDQQQREELEKQVAEAVAAHEKTIKELQQASKAALAKIQ